MEENPKQEIYESLASIQKKLPVIGKNKKGYNYTYADIEHIWEVVGGLILENGFVITNQVEQDGIRTIAHHKSGQRLESFVPFSKVELKPQEKGSEITYYRRYNLTAIFNIIIADEDDDAQSTVKKPKYTKQEIDVLGVIKKLRTAKNLSELQIFWKSLTEDERGNRAIEAAKDDLKSILK